MLIRSLNCSNCTYVDESRSNNDTRTKVFSNEEGPCWNTDTLVTNSEGWEPSSYETADKNDEDGGDAHTHAAIIVVVAAFLLVGTGKEVPREGVVLHVGGFR